MPSHKPAAVPLAVAAPRAVVPLEAARPRAVPLRAALEPEQERVQA